MTENVKLLKIFKDSNPVVLRLWGGPNWWREEPEQETCGQAGKTYEGQLS